MQDEKAFLLEEYKALRKEVELYITEIRSQERYTAVAVSAVWYWLIQSHKTHWLLWLLPVLVCCASQVRLYGIERHFKNLGPYLAELEKAFGAAGWEQRPRVWSIERVNRGLGAALLLLTLVALLLRDQLAK